VKSFPCGNSHLTTSPSARSLGFVFAPLVRPCCASRGACFERAHNSLNQGSANTESFADFQQANAVLVETQDALFKLRPCHAPAQSSRRGQCHWTSQCA
jgi:hypothetical protein